MLKNLTILTGVKAINDVLLKYVRRKVRLCNEINFVSDVIFCVLYQTTLQLCKSGEEPGNDPSVKRGEIGDS